MDDDQQFCLRWNNHQSTLISVFDTLLENGTLVDCTLAAEGKFLKAHKVVLSACSPYFATLLSQQYDKHPIFILKDVKFQELRAMMDYMYRGEVNISQDQLAALLKAAESLQIKGLSDNRSSSSSASGTGGGVHPQQQQKQSDAPTAKSLQPPVPASKASGLTIENKRTLKSELLESDVSGSREGSTSPTSRKRKKVRRRSVDTNNLLIDNHDQHSNSSSHSMHTGSGANAAVSAASANVAASSLSSSSSTAAVGSNSSANVLSVAAVAAAAALKKTETVQQAAAETLKLQKQQAAAAAAAAQSSDDDERCGPGSVATGTEHDDGNDLSDNEHDGDGGSSVKSGSRHHHLRDGSRRGKTSTSSMGEMMIEPKSEYEDVQDENVEDLTMDDEDLMDELDQPGPSHGGDVSSQGYAQWPMDREQNEAFIAAQDAVGGQHRDAQVSVPVGEASDTDGGGGGTARAPVEAVDDTVNDPGNDGGASAAAVAAAVAATALAITTSSGGGGSSSNVNISGGSINSSSGSSAVPPGNSYDSKSGPMQPTGGGGGGGGGGCSNSSSASSSSNSSSSSSSNSSCHSGVTTDNSNAAAAAIALALNQQQPTNISVGSSAAAAAAAVVALVGGPLMAEYIKGDVGVTFPLAGTQPSPPSPLGSGSSVSAGGGGGGGGCGGGGEGPSHKQQLVGSLKLQQSQTSQPLSMQHQPPQQQQQQPQTAALPLLSPKSPPIDEQPCDLRMLTPATYLREFASTVKPESFAAAAATAIKLAASANTGSASTAAALPMPMFKGMTTPPPMPQPLAAVPSPIVGGTYSCTRCGNSYARPHSLNRHIRFECGVEPKFECPVCHKKSKHKHNLVLHMRTHQHR